MTDDTDSDEHRPKQDYEVGYGRPPKVTQFKPGQSGNPKGRKRKPKSVQAQMQKVVSTKVAINEGGKSRSLPLLTVILRNIANKAAKGDVRAAGFVFNLLNSAEYADTDTIDQATLSPDDKAMLERVVSQYAEADPSQLSPTSDALTENDAESEPDSDLDESGPGTRSPAPEDKIDDNEI